MNSRLPASVVDDLRSPVSGLRLEQEGDWLVTGGGAERYRVAGGIPVLLEPGHLLFDRDAIAAALETPMPRRRSRPRRFIPRTAANPAARQRFAGLVARLRARSSAPKVLIIGGGEVGYGMEPLIEAADVQLVETDVYAGPRVSLVCDAHRLPFADASFDAVVAQAVLEHVLEPAVVAQEIHRVLRPDGLVYAETPLMQQVHEGPYDFTRFTEVGHRRLFRCFEALESGVAAGPGTALLWSLRYLARSAPRSPGAARVADRLVTLAFFWLREFDRWLNERPGAHDAASSYYFLGRRRDDPVPDLEILASYAGVVRSPFMRREGTTGPPS